MSIMFRSIVPLFAGLLLSLAMPPAWADAPGFIETQALFEQSLRGDSAASQKAYAGFRKLVRDHPDNPLYLAYLGANETLFARDDWRPWKRIKFLDRGLDHIDKALAMLGPEHDNQYERLSVISIETRLVALTTFLKVPEWSNRLQDARDLFAETLAQPVFAKAPPEVRHRIYLQGANIAARDGDKAGEIGYLKKALDARPDGYYADKIRQRLKKAAAAQ